MRSKYGVLINLAIWAGILLALSAMAQTQTKLEVPLPSTGGTVSDPAAYIIGIYRFMLGAGGVIALAVVVFGAAEYTVSMGNAARQQDARDRIAQALIGLALLFGAWLILNTIDTGFASLKLPGL